MTRIGMFAALLCLCLVSEVPAQSGALDRVDARLAAGEYAAARTIIQTWWEEYGDVVGGDAALRARALMLRARLDPDPRAAERDYLALVLGHPNSPLAAEALLRLGQGLLLMGDPYRAITYLERLHRDYPGSAYRDAGRIWLARALVAAGRRQDACPVVAGAPTTTEDATLIALLEAERNNVCAPTRPVQPPPETIAVPPPPSGNFAVQVGAFRAEAGARELEASVRRAGFEPRIVRVPSGTLLHVRIGRFQSSAEAGSMADRLRQAGFTAMIVDDANRERPL